MAAPRVDADSYKSGDYLCGLRNDAQVSRNHQIHAGTNCLAPNCRNRWGTEAAYPCKRGVSCVQQLEIVVPSGVLSYFAKKVAVCACAKRLPDCCNYDCAHAVVFV